MAKTKSNILTKGGKHLSVMLDGSGIEVDKTLLKYSSIKQELKEFKKNVAEEHKGNGETIEETKKRRNPILFGFIRGSDKLYYVTDWIDEYCDLTLDKFVETLQISKDNLKMKETL